MLYAVPSYKPAYRAGGPILSVAALAEGLVARGHRVVVFTSNSNVDEDLDVPTDCPTLLDGVEVWYFRRSEPLRLLPFLPYMSRSSGYVYCGKLGAAVRARIGEFDLVHLHMPFVYPTYAVGRAALRSRKPIFYHQRGNYDPERLRFRSVKKRAYIACVERPLMRNAAMLVALTEAERDSYLALGLRTRCRIVPNGIDADAYSSAPTGEFASRFHVGADRLVLLYLARLHPFKGADLLLDAFLRIAGEHPRAVLVFAGHDEWGMESGFRARAEAAGVGGRVLFPGLVSGTLKLDLLARADLLCLPSWGEGFSMAILEALASRTPVLISPGCHFPEVESWGAGWVVERTAERWAEALRAILTHPERLPEAGEAGRRLARCNYSWPSVVAQMEHVYQEGTAPSVAGSVRGST
jgi:glycosyltransferase involved in cell wall biosynthesis